jgi:protein tyrosine phosphatase
LKLTTHFNLYYQYPMHRYVDIIALDQTRVQLKHGGYLNANWVRDELSESRYAPQAFIMTQAPTVETMGDFYSAIFQNQVSVVVCLTPLIECGRVKANRYWPSTKQDSLNVGLWKIQMAEEDSYCRGAIIRRVLRMTRREPSLADSGEHELTFTMYHYLSWCDNASPTCVETFAELVRLVRAVADQDRSRPVLAHCSAGVGRAGTFVASYNLILLNEEPELSRVSVKEMVHWLRQQRYGAVQTNAQYSFIPKIVGLFELDQSSSSSSDSLSSSTASSDEHIEDEDLWLRTCQIPTNGVCVP